MTRFDYGLIEHPTERQVRRHNFRTQVPLLIALLALWLVLWGHVDVISVVTGIAFSAIAVRVFYLPAVALSGRFNLLRALMFLARFIWHLTIASFQMALLAVKPGRLPRNSIVAVRLRSRSDFILTLTAEVTILIPGSVVVDVDRTRSVLYLHQLAAESDADVEHARDQALRTEQELVLTLGSRDDIWRVNRDRIATGRRPVGQTPPQRAHEQLREQQLADRRSAQLTTTGSSQTDDELEDELAREAEAARRGETDIEGAGE
ncbi:MAG: Na+/H+ antiporter subunit E [Pseudoclavibacter sp.]